MVKLIKKTTLSLLLVGTLVAASCGSANIETDVKTESVISESIEEGNGENEVISSEVSAENVKADEEIKNDDNKDTDTEKESSDEAVPVLRDSMGDYIGGRIGCAVTGSEVDDPKVWEIVTTHFNAVTLGNELKPDCMFGYSNGTVPAPYTVEFGGESMVVPKLNYSRANKILDKFVEYNAENPDRPIKIRGHVLVWHSQTPEWFFHVDYDKNKPYADKATMNKRLEWYISSVLTYYTGEDSKYKDLFYGWDVVNEAISDRGGLRTDSENPNESLSNDTHGSNSSWYHVYGSNEFIINAFKYANKYAPETLELYYNDYNETDFNKQKSIIELLTAIKDAEGEPGVGTRITAMGMQGHYGMDSFSGDAIASAMKRYCKVVGAVQLTEVDIKINETYDTSADGIAEMNETIKKRYNMLVFNIKSAIADGAKLEGLTFWGTVDKYSWLQSRSNVGGGNTTSIPQLPLLFDNDYNPKPCFYVFTK